MAFLTGFAAAVLAAAAEGAAHATEAAAHGEAPHKTGLPQLATETFAGQVFWLAVSFIVLFALLTYVVIPRIRSVLEARRGTIAGDLAAANAAKANADAALAAYEKALGDARAHGRKLADETRNTAKAAADKARGEAEAGLAVKLAEADSRLSSMKHEAMSNIRSVASETAADIYARLTGEPMTAADAAKAVDAALTR